MDIFKTFSLDGKPHEVWAKAGIIDNIVLTRPFTKDKFMDAVNAMIDKGWTYIIISVYDGGGGYSEFTARVEAVPDGAEVRIYNEYDDIIFRWEVSTENRTDEWMKNARYNAGYEKW